MQQDWKGLTSYGTIGLEFALSVLLMLFAGHWLDGKLDSHPWFALSGMALGAAAGARSGYRTLQRANRQAQAPEQESTSRSRVINEQEPPDQQ